MSRNQSGLEHSIDPERTPGAKALGLELEERTVSRAGGWRSRELIETRKEQALGAVGQGQVLGIILNAEGYQKWDQET